MWRYLISYTRDLKLNITSQHYHKTIEGRLITKCLPFSKSRPPYSTLFKQNESGIGLFTGLLFCLLDQLHFACLYKTAAN